MMRSVFFLLLFFFSQTVIYAQVRLAHIFGDSMVLQRDQRIPVWGFAGKGEKVTVRFGNQSKTATADKNGEWKAWLDKMPAGGPFTLSVTGKNSSQTCQGVLMGDVWLCSGQSNMEFHVSGAVNAEKEIASANYPNIRHFYLPRDVSGKPKKDIGNVSSWKAATPGNVGDFTAVGYFFARELEQKLHVPIGLLHTSWGGTNIETWISHEGLLNSETFEEVIRPLPVLDVDSLSAVRKSRIENNLRTWQGGVADAAEIVRWKESGFDDSKWPKTALPSLWEAKMPDLDGVVWFRKTLTLSKEEAASINGISLGNVDDIDATYINGITIGSTSGYNLMRNYSIPTGVLKEGKNVIAIRVEDPSGAGGFGGTAKDMALTSGSNRIPLSGEWNFKVAEVSANNASVWPNSYPSLLYNAMIAPVVPYGIKGVLWYQGETNAERAIQYRQALPLLIKDWRAHWQQDTLPFYFVQLASFNATNGNSQKGSSWAELREAQTMTLQVPHTGMAVTTDVGESTDIHPKNKQDVGKRLAAVALHDTYGMSVPFSGPVYASMTLKGNRAFLQFSNPDAGLVVNDKYGYLKGFEISGADKRFYYAKAYVDGNRVVVYSDSVSQPTAVHYGWADDAGEANLMSRDGFPASPFRTDAWSGVTDKVKYTVTL